jgi:hypothetical protein
MMTMGMEWNYVSELHPPTRLLLIPNVIYTHEEPWWNYISREKLIRKSDLHGNPTAVT